ncbi:DnaB-like helicase N-terminal domain-containing protein [Rhizobium mongolense]|uniref:Replicative DNA helicase n=1 Tax=Rhizobium mongolense TaxID=57676 RepID=A0A7W6WDV0_9HYPH|nr:DnaB-like helicase N-terminal domain-containing protein [Rhizobium mongolense]MBB4274175.1 replicative DNA helicase [Rhizobium mongolense]
MDKITEDDVIEAEQNVLACIFANNEVLNECGLEDIDFADPLHQSVFAASQKLYSSHERVNAVSLKPFVPLDAGRANTTPAAYLSKLQIAGANPDAVRRLEGSLDIIKGMSVARQLAREAEFVASVAKEDHTLLTLGDEIEQLASRLKELRSRFAETTSISSPGASYLSAFQASSKRDGVVGVPIALSEIAKVLSEPVFEAGNLYGLLSSSGEGKSSLTMHLIYHAVREGHRTIASGSPHGLISSRLKSSGGQREGVGQLTAYALRFMKKRATARRLSS